MTLPFQKEATISLWHDFCPIIFGEMIDQENIQAGFENGILHVTLPKAAPVKKTKEITIK